MLRYKRQGTPVGYFANREQSVMASPRKPTRSGLGWNCKILQILA
jgi:hypothetical protein